MKILLNSETQREIEITESLEQQKFFLDSIIDNLPLAMFCKDYQQGGTFVGWNKTAESLWGLKTSEVLGKSDSDFFPADQSNFFKEKDLVKVVVNLLGIIAGLLLLISSKVFVG